MNYHINGRKLARIERLLRTRKRKVAASVTLAGELVDGMNLIVPPKQRSKFMETAVRRELRRQVRRARTAQDLVILNARAERLNRETDDLLELQGDPFE